jgi:integral membrane protein
VPAEPATTEPAGTLDGAVAAGLTRYRVMAWVVGVLLIVLTLVAMPLKYLADNDTPVAVVGVAHGFLYALFFLVTLDLALRARWRPLSALLVVLAGTVPFLSFYAERTVTRRMRAGERV